ncbi:putative C2H2 finger domain protein [Aspergillus lucknowensis]|uniref:C2H2-type domain-containing protein n=1 Tax=Aspergillus lucknowensis TaxID=176173 RepID=A0ABR4LEY4_9EURO
MPPRGFTNPAPKTDSARSALSSFTCTLCNKSYSRHPEYEAHISSYDHQHRKRLQDLKQLSRDPNAAEKARRAEKKADAEAGLRVLDSGKTGGVPSTASSGGGGRFKRGGFKSSFTTVKGPAAPVAPTKKNVLGDDDEDGDDIPLTEGVSDSGPLKSGKSPSVPQDGGESDTDEEYAVDNPGEGYYDPRRPTGCFPGCIGSDPASVQAAGT